MSDLFDDLSFEERAIALLRSGEPVPLDLIYRLTEAGIDFSELESKYAV